MTTRFLAFLGLLIGSVHLVAACGSSSSSSSAGGGSSGTGAAGGSGATGGTGGATGGASGAGGATGGASGAGGATGGASGSAGASGTCRSASDCSSNDFCAVYTLPPICGGVYDTGVDNCLDDSDCADGGADYICDSQLCVFPHGGGIPFHCKKGCSKKADCGPGLDCDSTHRCVPQACTTPSDCESTNFVCSTGHCAAKPCSGDAECGDFCVNSTCSATIGQCEPAVP
jgi:hypothetical protein